MFDVRPDVMVKVLDAVEDFGAKQVKHYMTPEEAVRKVMKVCGESFPIEKADRPTVRATLAWLRQAQMRHNREVGWKVYQVMTDAEMTETISQWGKGVIE